MSREFPSRRYIGPGFAGSQCSHDLGNGEFRGAARRAAMATMSPIAARRG
jgi:hypothetical protein